MHSIMNVQLGILLALSISLYAFGQPAVRLFSDGEFGYEVDIESFRSEAHHIDYRGHLVSASNPTTELYLSSRYAVSKQSSGPVTADESRFSDGRNVKVTKPKALADLFDSNDDSLSHRELLDSRSKFRAYGFKHIVCHQHHSLGLSSRNELAQRNQLVEHGRGLTLSSTGILEKVSRRLFQIAGAAEVIHLMYKYGQLWRQADVGTLPEYPILETSALLNIGALDEINCNYWSRHHDELQ